jgi:hypothetical protein
MKTLLKYILLLTVVFLSIAACAQVTIKASVNRDKILIGEPIQLTVEAYTPLGVTLQWANIDSIQHFEITERGPVDTVANMDGKKTVLNYTITAFDSGHLQIPPFEVAVNGQSYYSDSILIDVAFISFDPKEDYRDIKQIIKPKEESPDYLPWLIALTIIVGVVIVLYIFRKKKKTIDAKPAAPRLSPYEEAMQAFKLLQKETAELTEKAYYTRLNDILRKYVSGKFNIPTFERTNEELIWQLSKMNLPKEAFSSLSHSLRIADFVKFAKFRPSAEDNKNNMEIVRNSIKVLENSVARAV